MKPLLSTLLLVSATTAAWALPVTYQFSGTTQATMAVNNGSNTGSLPAGTPFTGTFTYDNAQVPASVAFSGGTHTTYTFTTMTLTVAGSTVSWGPGTMDLYFHLTNTSGGYPVGDSFYVNISSMVAPGGLINGAAFNWVLLGFVDNTGTAFTSAALPANLNFASFQSQFAEFNYGTAGVPFGGGNTSYLQFLSSLVNVTSAAPPTITTTSLPVGVYGVPYNAAIAASAPNPVTVAVTGLPAGLSFNGTAIVGTPSAVGTSNITITATDSVTKLSTSATLPLVVHDAAITFAPSLSNGVVNAAYSSTFAAATGGTGTFTYTASGLPTGLVLSGNTVSGIPATAGISNVTLTATDSAGTSISVAVTLTINNPVPVTCSGTKGVESAYVARNPGFVAVNGGLNLLDHLWTSNLTPSNTTFLGGLVNWFQTGLILTWTGTVDPAGCILSSLTVSPAVSISTTTLPGGTAGLAYVAPVTVAWGVPPYNVTLSGLPAGLTYTGGNLTGVPAAVGTFAVTVTAVDAVGATATKALSLTILDQSISFAPGLPTATVGSQYSAAMAATGFGPFTYKATGLPAGLTLTGNTISGTPSAAGSSAVNVTATDASSASVSALVTLTVNPAPVGSGNYTIQDESSGKITAIDPNFTYLIVGTKKLIWNGATRIQVNTGGPDLHVVNSFVKAGMVVQWKGLRDKATNTVLTSQIEIN